MEIQKAERKSSQMVERFDIKRESFKIEYLSVNVCVYIYIIIYFKNSSNIFCNILYLSNKSDQYNIGVGRKFIGF